MWLLVISSSSTFASSEGTRHITGSGINLHFMNDKVFGTANTSPLWAIYNCGTAIKGEIDIKGTYHSFDFAYHNKGGKIITGTFGPLKMSMGKIKKTSKGILYQVFVDNKKHAFSIQYEKVQNGHMINSIIQGNFDKNRPIFLKTNGQLCPFATTGIIMITLGAAYLTGN
ncbi:MAG: hypothetical protein JRI53_00370 [Deltaproteobacteria bacterium]|nr:hypothetical protein [Deltaproteobacteria bacterium]